jgi:hypothetical protein
MHRAVLALLPLIALAVSGCTSARETNPSRTATEELLVSRAADHAARQLDLGLPLGTKIFLDTSYIDGPDAKYAVAAIRDLRIGALSIDKDTDLVGTKSFDIPVPLSTGTLTFPEIALWKKYQRIGIAKFAITGYDAHNGGLAASAGPVIGYSQKTHYVVLLFFSRDEDDLIPDDQRFEKQIKRQDAMDSAARPSRTELSLFELEPDSL